MLCCPKDRKGQHDFLGMPTNLKQALKKAWLLLLCPSFLQQTCYSGLLFCAFLPTAISSFYMNICCLLLPSFPTYLLLILRDRTDSLGQDGQVGHWTGFGWLSCLGMVWCLGCWPVFASGLEGDLSMA